jgi:hypothetical protein
VRWRICALFSDMHNHREFEPAPLLQREGYYQDRHGNRLTKPLNSMWVYGYGNRLRTTTTTNGNKHVESESMPSTFKSRKSWDINLPPCCRGGNVKRWKWALGVPENSVRQSSERRRKFVAFASCFRIFWQWSIVCQNTETLQKRIGQGYWVSGAM